MIKGKIERIWLIDDSEIDNFIASTILQNEFRGLKTINFVNALIAWQTIKNSKTNELPQIIILDWHLPLMTSERFINELSNCWPSDIKKPLICLVSSSLNKKEILPLASHPWIDGYISKPLMKENLISILKNTVVSLA
ncbi:MAG: response regulator [Cytophagia bacterium]|nr:MAG: response regulator [Cytophagales bacterium]TAG05560.1 MAG: response regulator [Cytophagia bacterium]TAG43936.1 MAG: response regulator [Cytophagia bacterium]TAH29927.1 MAG: response regulator [Cytophagales bacterium]